VTEQMNQRKHPRLKGYDYGQDGVYFITACTNKKRKVLSRIVGRGLAPAAVLLLPAGQLVSEELENLKTRFPTMSIDQAVIMPNHIHLLLRLSAGASPRPTEGTIMDIMRVLKSMTTRRWNTLRGTAGQKLWQPSFYDHIIRDETDYLTKWNYIETNPARWAEDEYYTGRG
jgi:putative transposase